MPGCGIGKDGLLGLEDPLEAGKTFLGDGAELGAVEVDRAAIHRPQYPIRDVGWTRVDKKMVSATDRHACSPAQPIRNRSASDPRPLEVDEHDRVRRDVL